jgi:peptidoglycan/xylan/chitin deacetylase (PgdA/CDA1 family)
MLIATSWDDGLESDRRLLSILDRYNVRSSFALSPARHRATAIPNDVRDTNKYGMLLPVAELNMYQEHDVVSHTVEHREQTKLDELQLRLDLYNGKIQLEDIFKKPIVGIVWPYGCSNSNTILHAQQLGYDYGRVTPAKHRSWHYQKWDIVPWSWHTPLEDLLKYDFRCLALSGHTYEFRNENDWEYVERFYRDASRDSRCNLVTLTELAQTL